MIAYLDGGFQCENCGFEGWNTDLGYGIKDMVTLKDGTKTWLCPKCGKAIIKEEEAARAFAVKVELR